MKLKRIFDLLEDDHKIFVLTSEEIPLFEGTKKGFMDSFDLEYFLNKDVTQVTFNDTFINIPTEIYFDE